MGSSGTQLHEGLWTELKKKFVIKVQCYILTHALKIALKLQIIMTTTSVPGRVNFVLVAVRPLCSHCGEHSFGAKFSENIFFETEKGWLMVKLSSTFEIHNTPTKERTQLARAYSQVPLC